MKFFVPNYSCLQNPWLRGYCPQIPFLSVLCPQLNLLNPPEKKSWVRHCLCWCNWNCDLPRRSRNQSWLLFSWPTNPSCLNRSSFISIMLNLPLKHSEGKCDKPEIHTTEATVNSMETNVLSQWEIHSYNSGMWKWYTETPLGLVIMQRSCIANGSWKF